MFDFGRWHFENILRASNRMRVTTVYRQKKRMTKKEKEKNNLKRFKKILWPEWGGFFETNSEKRIFCEGFTFRNKRRHRRKNSSGRGHRAMVFGGERTSVARCSRILMVRSLSISRCLRSRISCRITCDDPTVWRENETKLEVKKRHYWKEY